MNEETLINIRKLRPFTRFIYTIGELPTSYLMSMTYEEQLIWLCNYLEKTVKPAINNNGQAVEELQNLYLELKSYVDNYFEDLDVQEEINNKLDDMAEQGELTDIIAQYLGLAGVLAYGTLNDLINAENVANGSICYIIGKITYNDGLGAYYKIRNILNTDVIDGDNIISITNNVNLVGEKLPNSYIGNLSNLDTINKSNLVNAINEVYNRSITATPDKPIDMKKVIFIGDSYASRTNNWVSPLITKLGLQSGDYYIGALGSTGFCCPNNTKVWLTLLEEIVDDLTTSQKQEISHIIVCGGANDNTYTLNEIDTAIGTFVSYVNTNLPNAKTLIGEIGWTSDTDDIINYGKVVEAYTKCNKYNNCYYLNNVQYTLHNYDLLESDKVHPTANGCSMLANNIHQCIMTGFCDIVYNQLTHKLNPSDNNRTFYESLNNNLVCVYNNRASIFTVNVNSIVANGVNSFELTEDIFQYAKGSYYESNKTFVVAYITVNGSVREIYCNVGIYDGKLRLYPMSLSGGNYETLSTITNIRIPQFKIIMDALQC